jgi:hypothetical protein
MSDNRPDYAKFMKNQSPAEIDKSSRTSGDLSHRPLVEDEDIPWAEIIDEPEYDLDYYVDSDSSSRVSPPSAGPAFGAAPPIAVLVAVALVVVLFLLSMRD